MAPILLQKDNLVKKKRTYILIFIQKIPAKSLQDLMVFLQKNDFRMKRITKKSAPKDLVLSLTNSNFILESDSDIPNPKLQSLIVFLKKYTLINGIFFQNQVLNLERISRLEEKTPFYV